jgi:hypothetical protein
MTTTATTSKTITLTCTNTRDSTDVVLATISNGGEQLAWADDFGTSSRTSEKDNESDYGKWSKHPDLNPTIKLPGVLVLGFEGQATVQFSGEGAPAPSHYYCRPRASSGHTRPTGGATNTCTDPGERCESRAACEGGDGAVNSDHRCSGTLVCCAMS